MPGGRVVAFLTWAVWGCSSSPFQPAVDAGGGGGEDGAPPRDAAVAEDEGVPPDAPPPEPDTGPVGSCLPGLYSGTATLVGLSTASATIALTLDKKPVGEFYEIVAGSMQGSGSNSLGQTFAFSATLEGSLDCPALGLVGGAFTSGSVEICSSLVGCYYCYFVGSLDADYDWIEHRFVSGTMNTQHCSGPGSPAGCTQASDIGTDCNDQGTWQADLAD